MFSVAIMVFDSSHKQKHELGDTAFNDTQQFVVLILFV